MTAALALYLATGALLAFTTWRSNRLSGERFTPLAVLLSTALITALWPLVLAWARREARRS